MSIIGDGWRIRRSTFCKWRIWALDFFHISFQIRWLRVSLSSRRGQNLLYRKRHLPKKGSWKLIKSIPCRNFSVKLYNRSLIRFFTRLIWALLMTSNLTDKKGQNLKTILTQFWLPKNSRNVHNGIITILSWQGNFRASNGRLDNLSQIWKFCHLVHTVKLLYVFFSLQKLFSDAFWTKLVKNRFLKFSILVLTCRKIFIRFE